MNWGALEGEQWLGLSPMSIPSELGYLAVLINFLPKGKISWTERDSNRDLGPESNARDYTTLALHTTRRWRMIERGGESRATEL